MEGKGQGRLEDHALSSIHCFGQGHVLSMKTFKQPQENIRKPQGPQHGIHKQW